MFFLSAIDGVLADNARYMGALTNNGRKLANFAGFYKGIQSAGAAIVWRMDSVGVPYMHMFASCWGLLAGSLIIALPVLLLKIKDTSSLDDDLKFMEIGPKPGVDGNGDRVVLELHPRAPAQATGGS